MYILSGDQEQLEELLREEIAEDDIEAVRRSLQELVKYGVQSSSSPTPSPAPSPVPVPAPSPSPVLTPTSTPLAFGKFCTPPLNLSFHCKMEEWAYKEHDIQSITTELIRAMEDLPKSHEVLFSTLLYFIKRKQSLQPLVRQLQHSTNPQYLSQRMLVNLLLANSDELLRQKIIYNLSVSNPVPLTGFEHSDPSSHFFPEAYWILDNTKLLLFSYGIGECKGKSTLLNQLFGTSFEESNDTMWFNSAIDYQNDDMTSSGIAVADGHGEVREMAKICMADLADVVILHSSFDVWQSKIKVIQTEMEQFAYRVKLMIILVRDGAERKYRKLPLDKLGIFFYY